MLRATFINDEVSRDLDEAIRFACAERLEAIELRMIGDRNVIELDREELEGVRDRVVAAGLEVAAISTPLFKCPLELEGASEQDYNDPFRASFRGFADHLTWIPRAAAAATLLGTRRIRCFAFLGTGELEPVRSEIVARLRLAGRRLAAEDDSLRFCLENEHTTFVRTAAEVGSIVAELGEPFVVLWDPGNAYYAGERAPELDVDRIAGMVEHVHLKDPLGEAGEIRYVPLGEGRIDYPAQIRALVGSGYRGFVSLEPHIIVGESSLDGARRCLRFLQPLLDTANS